MFNYWTMLNFNFLSVLGLLQANRKLDRIYIYVYIYAYTYMPYMLHGAGIFTNVLQNWAVFAV
jgi:hypothetical protein